MLNKNSRSIITIFICLVLILSGCSSGKKPASSDEKVVLKVGHINAPDHPWNIALEGFAKDVSEATNGNLEIQVFPSSQLGGERDMAEGLKLGTLDMGLFGTGALQSLDKRLIVEELPYAWSNRNNAYEALDGELGDELNKILKGHSIVGLSYWESGYRHITNSVRPINSLEDLKGLKLRVPEAEMRIDTFKDLGALPTPLAFSEVFTALQQGTVDGQENPLPTISSSKFNEVQKHLMISGHIWGSALLGISDKSWNGLSDDYKKIISEKADIWKIKEREMIQNSEKELLESLKASGMEVTEPDVQPFKDAVQGVWAKYESQFGKDLVDVVRKYSK
ncbi:DctP family TRAP transporter solute-binding subunit [Tissierella praeacuta]|uniref:TRAP transporter substrate-binding protein n=1 Tax=Tissierella praeacuta TaxID=43131 RepID=UPI001C10FA23|nr:DctP family TRAP transporter solute-binding subunit [Tissierella praeacuta]MBU5255540.1 DctP family TRAP transporter solute-binding subunit [Tissierella praeacuta]